MSMRSRLDGATKIVVYYTDEAGKKVAHYLKESTE